MKKCNNSQRFAGHQIHFLISMSLKLKGLSGILVTQVSGAADKVAGLMG